MSRATCGACGSPMRQTYMYLTLDTGCQQIPTELVCTDGECRDRQRAQDRADQAERDAAAIARAVERGVILP